MARALPRVEELKSALQSRGFDSLELLQLEVSVVRAELDEKSREELLQALRQKRAEVSAQAKAGRAQMQDWTSFPAFLTADHWARIQAGRKDETLAVLHSVVDHLHGMGLRHPSELTEGVLTSLLLWRQTTAEMSTQYPFHQTMKAHVKARLSVLSKGDAKAPGGTCLQVLPACADLLPEEVRVAATSGGPLCEPPMDLLALLARAKCAPLRSSNRMAPKSMDATAAANPAAALFMGMLQQFGQQLFASGSSAAQPPVLALPATPPASRLRGLLALEDGPAVPSKPRPETLPEPRAAAPQEPQAVVPQEPRAMQAAAPGEQVGEQELQLSSREQLQQPGHDEDKTATPLAQDQDETAGNSIEESMLRLAKARCTETPADQICKKRPSSALPAAPRKPQLKRPAAAYPMQRPAASAGAAAVVRKRPAASSAASRKRPAAQLPDRATRLRLRPEGCTKCRWQAGCCPSCWR